MPSLESRPAFTPPEIVEKKATRERFATTETHIQGVSLRGEPGVILDILRKTTEDLYDLAKNFVPRKLELDNLTKQQKAVGDEIKKLAKTHEGLRGIQSQPEHFVLTVSPSDAVTYDRNLLRKSLGIVYPLVVHEYLAMNILIPVGFPTQKGPMQEELLRQVLVKGLLDIGLTQEDLDKIMLTKTIQRVDAETIESMVSSGQVSLLEGTKQIERTWSITTHELKP